MNPSSDRRPWPGYHKWFQLEQLVFTYNSILEENKFQKEYLDSFYSSEMDKIIKSTEITVKELNQQIEQQTNSIEQDCLNTYHKQIKRMATEFKTFLDQKTKRIENLSTHAFSELKEAMEISQQCEHNTKTAINALQSQKKITENEIYHGIKNLDVQFLQKKKEYSNEIDKKILLLQEQTNKSIKSLTEIQINASGAIQKEFLKANNPLKVKELKNLLNRTDILKFQCSTMKDSVQSLIVAENHHTEKLKSDLAKICQDIQKIQDFANELKLNQKKTGTDLHFAIRTCQQFLELDKELKKIIETTKIENSRIICIKYKEYENYENILNELRNENQIKINEKKDKIHQIKISHNGILSQFSKQLNLEIEQLKEQYLKENIKYEEKIIQNREILNQKMQEKFDVDMFVKNLRNENQIDQNIFNEERNRLKQAFEAEIKEENECFKKKCEEIQRSAVESKNQIDEATKELSRLRIQLQSISSLNSDDVIIIEDEDEFETEIEIVKNQQEQEFLNKSTSNEKLIKQMHHQFEREENNLVLQIEDNYQQSIRNTTMILKSNRNDFKKIDNEYQKQIDIETKYLNEIENDPLFKGSTAPFIQNGNSPLFEKANHMIESLKHRLFELKNTVSFQKVNIEVQYSSQIEQEEKRFKEEMMKFSGKTTELISLKKKLNMIRLEKMEIENQLKNQLSELKEQNEMIQNERQVNLEKLEKDDQLSFYADQLEQMKNESKSSIDQATISFETEIKNLTDQLDELTNGIENEKSKYLNDIQCISKEIVLFDEKKAEQLKLMKNVQIQNIQKEKDDFSIKMGNKSLQFKENKARIDKLLQMYKKTISDEENFHFFNYHQNRSQYIVAIDDLSKNNREKLEELKSHLDAMIDFANDQISVIQEKAEKAHQLFIEKPPRQSDSLIIDRLEKQLISITSQLTILCKALKETKDIYKKKEKEYNHRFGINPKVGILKGRPLCVSTKVAWV